VALKLTRRAPFSGRQAGPARKAAGADAECKALTRLLDRSGTWDRDAARPSLVSRRSFGLAAAAAVLLPARRSRADEPSVPVSLQVELLAKVANYDRNLPARAGGKVQVLILTKSGNPDSSRAAGQMQRALGGIAEIAGLPHEEIVLPLADAAALAAAVRAHRAAVVYVTPGLGTDVTDLARALGGVDVLTIAAMAADVARGVVLGFDLVSSRPKLLVNLAQARLQNVAFRAEVLKLMQVESS
jgi:hypothetical protein